MMLADFHFLRPWWLLAILPAATLLYFLIKHKYQRGDWSQVCDAELLPFILQDTPIKTRPTSWFSAGLMMLLCILALAGPTWQRFPSPAFRNDSALVIALDLSKSMDATDIKPNRISRARYKISDILKQRKDGQTALLVYSGDAFIVTPLTTDTATINSQLEALTTDIMPSPGSNTGVAMQKAVDLLKQAGLAQGHILLVTDGADTDSLAKASRVLGDYQLSVLALGSSEGAPIPVPGGGFLKDAQGNIVVAKLDVAELSELAASGRGIFQQVTANDGDVEKLGSLFNKPMSSESTGQTDLQLQQWDEKGPWLLLLVLPWAALRFRKGLLAIALVFLLPLPQDAMALDWQSLWQTQDQRAQQAFQQQQYEQAAEQFNNPDWRAAAQYKAGKYQEAVEALKDTQTADGHYNRGNALAKAGELQEAIKAYEQTLKLDPAHADAKHNKEQVEKQLKKDQQQKQPDQNQQSKDQSSKDQNQQDSKSSQSDQQKQDQKDQNQSQAQNQAQPDQQQDTDKPAEQPKQGEDKQPQPEQQADKPDDARRSPKQPKPQQASKQAPSAQQSAEQDEVKRANEQLLKRIPDEPTGLLKRKFKYQYGQRDPPAHIGPDW
jgi:Ca-activated chloride channel family protein